MPLRLAFFAKVFISEDGLPCAGSNRPFGLLLSAQVPPVVVANSEKSGCQAWFAPAAR